MKRFSKIIMLMTVLLCLFILPTEAEATYYSNGFYYSLSNGKATITECHTSVSGALVIPATINSYPVTAIGNNAFYNCTALTSVTIPDGVTSIGNRAFKNCCYLTDITIPASVTRVGLDSFVDCSRLTSVHITDLAAWCGIWFGSELVSPYSNPLCYADNLYLNGTRITDLVIPDSVTGICTYAFAGYSGLTRVTIPDGVTNIGEGAFYGCNNLIGVTISDSVTTIGDEAFYSCDNLSDVTIGNGVTSIGSKVFHDTGYYKNASNWENDALYVGNYFIVAKPSITGACTIKANTRTIAEQAFISCTGLTSVTIPDSVIRIPSGVFHGCSSLESITIPFVGGSKKAASATYQYPFGYIFGTGSYTGGIATMQYYYGSSTSSNTYSTYYIPATLKSVTVTGGRLNYGAFYSCDNLSGVTIGNGVTSIGDCAFVGCSELTSITIPDSVTSIGKSAFYYCEGLTSVIIGNGVTSIGNNAFEGCNSLTSITIPNCVTKIREQAFKDCTSLTSITIPAGITEIGESSFAGCTNLTSINIPDSVTSIGAWAFSGCTNLTGSFVIPDGVPRLEMGTFMDCSSLRSVTIGSGVTRIDNYVFNNCSSLTNITIPANVQTIDEDVFSGCSSLTGIWAAEDSEYLSSDSYGVVFNKDITRLIAAPGMLSNCYTIPDGVNIIVRGAFFGCTNLTSIIVPGSVTGIYGYAFGSCPNLTSVTYCGTEVQWEQISILEDNDALSDAHRSYHNVVDGICNLCQHFGTCGDNLTWTLDDEGTLTISGTGVMKDYRGSSSTPWYSLQPSISRIVIENGVTTIGGSAFSGCASVTSVTIGDNVTSIGADAFLGCSELVSITIPHAITNIQKYAFMGCTALADVWYDGTKYEKAQISINSLFNGALINAVWHYPTCEIHEYSTACDTICDACDCVRVTSTNHIYDSIGDTICNECKQLRYLSYKIENGRASITDCVYTASSIIVPTQIDGYPVTSIANHAFCRKDQLTDIFLPDSITAIGTFAFEECTSLTCIIIPDNVTLIADCTFDGCENLVNVSIGKNVTKIGTYAFRGCDSLETIVFSNSVVSISERVFDGCASLTDVWYQGSADNYALIAIDNNGNESLTDATWHYNTCSAHSYTTNCDASCNACEWTRIPSDHVYTDITDTICNECGVARYWVEFRNYDDTKLSAAYYYLNDNVIPPANPTKAADNTYTYTFAGWDNDVVNCAGDATYTAIYTPTYINYTVTFKNWDGTVLSSKTYHWGDAVEKPGDPTRAADGAYIYTFAGWDNEVVNCAGDATYTATYTRQRGGTCGDNLTWTLDDEGTLTISGMGAMYNYGHGGDGWYQLDGGPWKDHHASITKIVISDGVTSIGAVAFYYFENLIDVAIGNNVASIGDFAFKNCTSLTSITIPKSVTSIGKSVFENCTDLSSIVVDENNGMYSSDVRGVLFNKDKTTLIQAPGAITGSYIIPASVTSIGASAFGWCANLTCVTVPNGVISIGDTAFSRCTSLTSIAIPDSVTSIGAFTFNCCSSLTSVTIGNGVTNIGIEAFISCEALASITIPNSVRNIDDGAFCWCDNLTSVIYCGTEEQWNQITIGRSNTDLTNAARSYHNWQDATCITPKTCSICGATEGAVSHNVVDGICTVCQHYGTCGDNLTWTLDDDGTLTISGSGAMHNYNNDAGHYAPWYSLDGFVTNVEILDGVTSIGDFAFSSCNSLICVTTSNSVTRLGDFAFYNCPNLTSITIGNGVSNIGNCAFKDCTGLINVTIPDSVTSIGAQSFQYCTGLTSATVGNGVTSIGLSAFNGCTNLVNVTMGNNVASIGHSAFEDCTSLTSITLPGSVTSISDYIFLNCSNLIDITVGNNVTSIGVQAFRNCTSLASIIIPDSVSSIGWQAFDGCTGLKSVTIGSSVASIGDFTFKDCTSLTSITIPNSVTSIGAGAFSNCSSLASVTISDGITSIGNFAFSDCTSLTKLIIAYGSQTITSDMVICEDQLTEIVIPTSVTSIGKDAFRSCASLTTATIPNSVTSIGDYAFSHCYDLTNVTIGDGVTSVGNYAFWYCTNLDTVIYSGTKSQWNAIGIGRDNECLTNAELRCMKCYVTFKDADGNVLTTTLYNYGDTVEIPHSPVKDADNTYTYTFAGWDKEVTTATKDVVYTATYTSTYINYTVTFKNWDGSVLSSKTYHYGDTVAKPTNPTKASDNTYSYPFAGWDKAVVPCAGDATYTATYTATYIDYTVTFKNWNGTVLSSKTYHYGDAVTAPTNPTKTADNTYTYTFAGWDNDVVACTGNATYTATYTSTYINYTVVFKNWDGEVLSTKTYHYGDTVAVPANPVRPNDNTYVYTFTGWDKMVVACNGNAVYTAVYSSKTRVPAAITSSTYTISNGTISKISTGTTVSTLVGKLNEGSYVKVYNGNQEVAGSVAIGTGMVVKIMDGNTAKTSYTIVVTGDTNGDGKITVTDMLAAKAHLLKKSTLTGASAKAADTSGDGGISITDFIQMKAHILGKSSVQPQKAISVVQTSVVSDSTPTRASNGDGATPIVTILSYSQTDVIIPDKKITICV